MPSRALTLSVVLLLAGAAGAAAHAPWGEGWVMPEGGLVLDGGDAESAAAAAPSLTASALAVVAAVPDPQAVPQPRPMAFEYSDGYRTRLKIHKYASFATLPLFVAQYAVGQKLYDGTGSDSTRSLHGALAASTAVLFGVNTITGVWNIAEGRKDPNHRTKRIVHGLLMAVADAGFVATGLMTPDHKGEGEFGYQSGGTSQSTHRAVALTSMGIATVGYLMMLFH
jgi:hypothetical protein